MHTVTVGEINSYIKRRMDTDINLSSVCVRGEISNFKHHYSGHMYMSLKDETGSIKAVMFRSGASNLRFEPRDGMSVLAFGRISVYERDGVYQLYIDRLVPDGIGQLYAAYEQLKARLESEGYFDPSHKKSIPQYPSVIGVVTASTGAAVRDIINVISRRYPLAKICIYPAKVQGEGSAQSVARGIELFNERKEADVIIVGRGGGSIEDLWAFNELIVAMAVYNSDIPIISAVGHETDYTIIDFVADLRAPTPSAAAEICTPDIAEIRDFLELGCMRLKSALTSLVSIKKQKLMSLMSSPVMRDPVSVIQDRSLYLDSVIRELKRAYERAVDNRIAILKECSYRLGALNPVEVLLRGFSVARKKDGTIIKRTEDAKVGEQITLTVTDGNLECIVSGGDIIGTKEEL